MVSVTLLMFNNLLLQKNKDLNTNQSYTIPQKKSNEKYNKTRNNVQSGLTRQQFIEIDIYIFFE